MYESKTQSGFRALHVAPALCDILERNGIIIPTEIQAQAIPIAMKGEDLVGIAQTGTGKTLAFGLPMIARLQKGQVGLVVAPTRELAQQIAETYTQLGTRCTLVVGGAPMHRQVRDLRGRPDVIVATPGRLIDHLNHNTVRLDNVAIVVLDEADRMLDMGFAPDIRRILEKVPTNRQTMLFSATMPKEIADLAANYTMDAKRIDVAPAGAASELVDQELAFVKHEEKQEMLAQLLSVGRGPVLVFTRTRHGARKLAKALRNRGHAAAEIHADRTLAQRREALAGFKSGDFRVLVATDIAARGIDVKEIELVVNYDLPQTPEDYVHRIGRTGRAGVRGRAVTLALREQSRDVRDIERLLGHRLPVASMSTDAPPKETVAPQVVVPKVAARPVEAVRKPQTPHSATWVTSHRGWSGRPKKRRMN